MGIDSMSGVFLYICYALLVLVNTFKRQHEMVAQEVENPELIRDLGLCQMNVT